MRHAVIVLFDTQSEMKIRAIWKQFELAGVGKTPGQLGEPPHVTFSEGLLGPQDKLIGAVPDATISDRRIKLMPFGVFPGAKYVLYYNAAPSEEMRRAYLSHYEMLRSRHVECNPQYSPDSILFHCTIAVDVERERLDQAFSMMLQSREEVCLRAQDRAVEVFSDRKDLRPRPRR